METAMSNARPRATSFEVIRLEMDGTATLSTTLVQLLNDALNKAEDVGETALLLVEVIGSGDPAMSHRWPGEANIQAVNKWERALRRIERAASSTVVLAQKNCSGLALELLLVADRRLARSDLRIRMAAPATWPGMAMYRLVNQIGYARSRKLMLFGAELGVELARELDLVDEIVGHSDIETAATASLLEFARAGDVALRRRLLQDSLSCSFDEALGVHLAACDRALRLQRGDAS
jgi:isomerase DpgB